MIFSGSTFSDIKLSFETEVGAKWKSDILPVICLFISSGKGESLLKVLKPAST